MAEGIGGSEIAMGGLIVAVHVIAVATADHSHIRTCGHRGRYVGLQIAVDVCQHTRRQGKIANHVVDGEGHGLIIVYSLGVFVCLFQIAESVIALRAGHV